MHIEQALYGSRDAAGYRFLARSPGFAENWLPIGQRLCTDFGERPAGVVCPDCLFVLPFDSQRIAIVQVSDRGCDDAGRPGALAFRLLVLPAEAYADLGGDPFLLVDQFPPAWNAAGELPTLTWDAGPPPRRTVTALQKVLDVPNSAVLLGGAQVLLDGGRLVFERREPADHLVRSIWALLPVSGRCRLWPATFVFADASRFHMAVVPRADDPALAHYVDEEGAGDYPEGRYELSLQQAVESGDQNRLDALFARRSRAQVLRLGIALLAVLVLGPAVVSLLLPQVGRPAATGKSSGPNLPPADEYPHLEPAERAKLAQRLGLFGARFGMVAPADNSEGALTGSLADLDILLGTPDPHRDPGPLRNYGPVQRQLRALLWKHSVTEFDAPGLNTLELFERLESKFAPPALRAN